MHLQSIFSSNNDKFCDVLRLTEITSALVDKPLLGKVLVRSHAFLLLHACFRWLWHSSPPTGRYTTTYNNYWIKKGSRMKYVCQKWGQRVGTPTYVTILQPTDTFPLPLLPLTSNLLVAVPFPPLPSPPLRWNGGEGTPRVFECRTFRLVYILYGNGSF